MTHPTTESELREKTEDLLRDIVERFYNARTHEACEAVIERGAQEILADREAVLREAVLKTEIRIHDEYWHSQRLVDESGIGPVALANKEATELELRKLQPHLLSKKDNSEPDVKEE